MIVCAVSKLYIYAVYLCCRYLENVPAIVPLLEKEYRNAAARLEATQEELNDLHPDKYAFLTMLCLLCHCPYTYPSMHQLVAESA